MKQSTQATAEVSEFSWELPSGSKGTYKGQAKNGKPLGWGQFKYLNKNEVYEGEYNDENKMTGIHKLMTDGSFYSYHKFNNGKFDKSYGKSASEYTEIDKNWEDTKARMTSQTASSSTTNQRRLSSSSSFSATSRRSAP